VKRRVIIKYIREMWCDTVGWIHLAEEVDSSRAVIDTESKLRFHIWRGYFDKLRGCKFHKKNSTF
jgi:hypothetical protein